MLAREGARKRDLVEMLSAAGVHLQLTDAPTDRALVDVLAEPLGRAQRARAVRIDVGVDDVMALLAGVTYSICHSRAGDDQASRLLVIMSDGFREHGVADGLARPAAGRSDRS